MVSDKGISQFSSGTGRISQQAAIGNNNNLNVASADSSTFHNDLSGATIANFANQVTDDARQQANQHVHPTAQTKTLANAAHEIQELLKQLEVENSSLAEADKIEYVNDETSLGFKKRVVGALRSGGEVSIEEFFDNSYVNIGKAIFKGWMNPPNS